jgi:cytochrome bd-type quinol oxidase subunit 1
MTRHPPTVKIVIKKAFLEYWDRSGNWTGNIIAYLIFITILLVMTIIVLLITIGTHNNKQSDNYNLNEMNESVHQN